MADAVNRAKHGDRVYFTVNRQLNPTNVCVLDCKFCDYAEEAGRRGRLHDDDGRRCCAHVEPEITEIHIVGGLHNKWRFDDYLDDDPLGEGEVAAHPASRRTPRSRSTSSAGSRGSRPSGCSSELREAGLDALPGGGAEVFSERVRREIFHQKIGAERWLEIHEIAHRMGIPLQLHAALRPHRDLRGARRST